MTHSFDFRKKVLSIKEKEALTLSETAIRFELGASTIKWFGIARRTEKDAK